MTEALGKVTGFALIAPFRAGPGYRKTKEVTVYLDPAAQGAGQGAALLDAMCDQAKAQGVTRIVAGIGGENPGAVGFFTAQGFTEVGRLPGVGFKFDREMDLILMMRQLGQ